MVLATRNGPSVEYRLADLRLIQALDLLRAVLRDGLSHRIELFGVIDSAPAQVAQVGEDPL